MEDMTMSIGRLNPNHAIPLVKKDGQVVTATKTIGVLPAMSAVTWTA